MVITTFIRFNTEIGDILPFTPAFYFLDQDTCFGMAEIVT